MYCWTYGFTHYTAHVIPSPIDLELNLESFSHADVYTKLVDKQAARRPDFATYVRSTYIVASELRQKTTTAIRRSG